MRFIVILYFSSFTYNYLLAQTVNATHCSLPSLDTSAFSSWEFIGSKGISPNGHFVTYDVHDHPSVGPTLVIESTIQNWRRVLYNIRDVQFTTDSRLMIGLKGIDSICLVSLGSPLVNYIPGVKSYKLIKEGSVDKLIYLLKGGAKQLIICDLDSAKKDSLSGINNYYISDKGEAIVLDRQIKMDTGMDEELIWFDLKTGNSHVIWSGSLPAANLIFDGNSEQIAFVASKGTIWYYKGGMDRATLLIDQNVNGVDSTLELHNGGVWSFSRDGKSLFFTVEEKENSQLPMPSSVKVDIWSYLDPELQSKQLKEVDDRRSYIAVMEIINRRIMRLQQDNEEVRLNNYYGRPGNIIYLTRSNGGSPDEQLWNKLAVTKEYIRDINTGREVGVEMRLPEPLGFSPSGRYIIGANKARRDLLCYQVSSGKVYNLTKNLPIQFNDEASDYPGVKPRVFGVAGWLEHDSLVMVYDMYDIWLIDPQGLNSSINLTNGYGYRHKIAFGLTESRMDALRTIKYGETLLLTAFNQETKENGFYLKKIGQSGNPQLLSKGPYDYFFPGIHPNPYVLHDDMAPIKALDTALWLITRQSAEESPNVFITSDFKQFKPISQVYPEKKYNWLRSELVTYRSLDGDRLQGILYKPGNFNPKKKYPLIIHYYERMSERLHKYLHPFPIHNYIDIPWFVSRGYLVFTPDICYHKGHTGKSVVSSVVGAAKYLGRQPWVDKSKIGIQGHSFGGYETDYIITHTSIFAAAFSSSGFCDLISGYNSIDFGEGAAADQLMDEGGQSRIGASFWKHPELYYENSPILQANHVTTPLLMMNNKIDAIVNFSQGVEFFVALRRLGKRVWMLQYDNEAHNIAFNDIVTALQHTIRVTQFFDHYLKGKPAPKWMTRGIPAKMKGIDDGLDYDPEINTPPPGLLIDNSK